MTIRNVLYMLWKRISIDLQLACFALEITYFYDGDTFKIYDNSHEYKLRLTDMEAPERNQA